MQRVEKTFLGQIVRYFNFNLTLIFNISLLNYGEKNSCGLNKCFSTGKSRPTFGSRELTFGSPKPLFLLYMGRRFVFYSVLWVANF